MIYIKVRKQVPQVSQVVTLSPIKQEKALLGQIVSTPNSSATFWKSCTTFGRRNYLLRLSQILHDDRHLLFQEAVAVFVVSQGVQLVHHGAATHHPSVQVLQSSGTLRVGAV